MLSPQMQVITQKVMDGTITREDWAELKTFQRSLPSSLSEFNVTLESGDFDANDPVFRTAQLLEQNGAREWSDEDFDTLNRVFDQQVEAFEVSMYQGKKVPNRPDLDTLELMNKLDEADDFGRWKGDPRDIRPGESFHEEDQRTYGEKVDKMGSYERAVFNNPWLRYVPGSAIAGFGQDLFETATMPAEKRRSWTGEGARGFWDYVLLAAEAPIPVGTAWKGGTAVARAAPGVIKTTFTGKIPGTQWVDDAIKGGPGWAWRVATKERSLPNVGKMFKGVKKPSKPSKPSGDYDPATGAYTPRPDAAAKPHFDPATGTVESSVGLNNPAGKSGFVGYGAKPKPQPSTGGPRRFGEPAGRPGFGPEPTGPGMTPPPGPLGAGGPVGGPGRTGVGPFGYGPAPAPKTMARPAGEAAEETAEAAAKGSTKGSKAADEVVEETAKKKGGFPWKTTLGVGTAALAVPPLYRAITDPTSGMGKADKEDGDPNADTEDETNNKINAKLNKDDEPVTLGEPVPPKTPAELGAQNFMDDLELVRSQNMEPAALGGHANEEKRLMDMHQMSYAREVRKRANQIRRDRRAAEDLKSYGAMLRGAPTSPIEVQEAVKTLKNVAPVDPASGQKEEPAFISEDERRVLSALGGSGEVVVPAQNEDEEDMRTYQLSENESEIIKSHLPFMRDWAADPQNQNNPFLQSLPENVRGDATQWDPRMQKHFVQSYHRNQSRLGDERRAAERKEMAAFNDKQAEARKSIQDLKDFKSRFGGGDLLRNKNFFEDSEQARLSGIQEALDTDRINELIRKASIDGQNQAWEKIKEIDDITPDRLAYLNKERADRGRGPMTPPKRWSEEQIAAYESSPWRARTKDLPPRPTPSELTEAWRERIAQTLDKPVREGGAGAGGFLKHLTDRDALMARQRELEERADQLNIHGPKRDISDFEYARRTGVIDPNRLGRGEADTAAGRVYYDMDTGTVEYVPSTNQWYAVNYQGERTPLTLARPAA